MSAKFPGDWAAGELSELAKILRDDASREPGQRRLCGTSGNTLLMAADLLAALAVGADARKLIDWRRKAMPRTKAVEAVLGAACDGATDWSTARATAAEKLGLELRTIERHWAEYLRQRGMTESDYLLP